jgi:hypothetical protein
MTWSGLGYREDLRSPTAATPNNVCALKLELSSPTNGL